MEFTLKANPPFSFNSVVRSHGWSKLAPFTVDDSSEELTYIAHLTSDRVVAISIRDVKGGVKVVLDSPLIGTERSETETAVNWMLGLKQDFSKFYALTQHESKLKHVRNNAQGRLLRSPTLFEDVIKTILTTNTSWSGTIRMVEALVHNFGKPLPDDNSYHAFPEPKRLAQVDEKTLRSVARLGYRAPYVSEIARQVASGSLDLELYKVKDIPSEELRKELLAIKGIGEYAAANLLMILGRYDFVPVDSWARKLVSYESHRGEPVGKKEVEAAFEDWGKWKGLAFWFWDWSYNSENTQ
jgi:3-methyladenine DNA glycosylase/8-oxoguanine DNA glycosylase